MTFNPRDYLIKLQGKEYLQVPHRVMWFRTEHPKGNIETQILSFEPLVARAVIYDGDGKQLASAHAGATSNGRKVVWSGREIEKAETAATGRALAFAGYGTQFTAEDEGEFLADSPVGDSQLGQSQSAGAWHEDKKNIAELSKSLAKVDKSLTIEFAEALLNKKRSEFNSGRDFGLSAIEAFNKKRDANSNALLNGTEKKQSNQYQQEGSR